MERVKAFFKNLTFKDYLLGLAFLLCGIFYFQYQHYYQESLNTKVVYEDSLSCYKNKIKDEYVAKNVYVQTTDYLKSQNSELSQELKNLKDNPIIVTKTKIVYKTDTLLMKSDSISIKDTVYVLAWSSNDKNYYSIKGRTQVNSDITKFNTYIDEMKMDLDLTLDVIEDGDMFKIITKSSNPYVTIGDVNGAIIDPNESKLLKSHLKKKKFSVGPHIGIGINNDLELKPYIGIGVQYNLFSF